MSLSVIVCAVAAAAALLLVLPPRATHRLARLDGLDPVVPGVARAATGGASRLRHLTRWARGRLRIGAAGRRHAATRRAQALDLAAALEAELRAGQPPRTALRRAAAAHHPPVCPRAAAAAAWGADVVAALRADEQETGLRLLRGLAACFEVGESSGAGLASAVRRLVDSARAAEDARVALEAQLAGPRTTARMLALLPVVGIVMGTALGTQPLAWLLGSIWGLACLTGGVALTALGLFWTARIAHGVEKLL